MLIQSCSLRLLTGVYNYISQNLSSSPSTDMFLMLDAFDIWLQQSPRALLRRYREIGAEVVIGADGWCWPNDPESVRLASFAFLCSLAFEREKKWG